MSKKLLMIIVAFVLVIGAAITFYTVNRSNDRSDASQSQNSNDQDKTDSGNETVAKTGTFGCLQPKGDGPHTMECAFGLTEDDGTAYGLHASDPTVFSGIGTNQKVEVTGTLSNPETTAKFDTAGTIQVTSLRKL